MNIRILNSWKHAGVGDRIFDFDLIVFKSLCGSYCIMFDFMVFSVLLFRFGFNYRFKKPKNKLIDIINDSINVTLFGFTIEFIKKIKKTHQKH
jgi:hypothetical protein